MVSMFSWLTMTPTTVQSKRRTWVVYCIGHWLPWPGRKIILHVRKISLLMSGKLWVFPITCNWIHFFNMFLFMFDDVWLKVCAFFSKECFCHSIEILIFKSSNANGYYIHVLLNEGYTFWEMHCRWFHYCANVRV